MAQTSRRGCILSIAGHGLSLPFCYSFLKKKKKCGLRATALCQARVRGGAFFGGRGASISPSRIASSLCLLSLRDAPSGQLVSEAFPGLALRRKWMMRKASPGRGIGRTCLPRTGSASAPPPAPSSLDSVWLPWKRHR